ncbi:hypothetical protein DNH61_11735 [Paenibacillus sambharensis]|uniref:Uncharacterized protein n=1 Tax=Paenibacillus sambharensis TaxID=1803190 RepID=A0A2W1LL51_9BACL|nr:hypothetical protein [Paenibacillus sambharensis]PZD95224.1 hypothetical protein DNH61_11735 [Paenibacillus sambharensis]
MDIVVIVAGLTAIFVVREYIHYKSDERKDALISELTDKLKASSFTEYREAKQEPQTVLYEPVSNDDRDLYERELQANKM